MRSKSTITALFASKVSPQSSPTRSNEEGTVATLRLEITHLQQKISEFERDLDTADADIKSLEMELFEAQQTTDKTPGALLFFAVLLTEGAVPNLQQLLLQLTHIKPVTDGSEHMDFPTLRRRLLVCVECLPNLSRLISKYIQLYNKWTADRLKLFTRRHLSGGNADDALICPLCNSDARDSEVERAKAKNSESMIGAHIQQQSIGDRCHHVTEAPGNVGALKESEQRHKARSTSLVQGSRVTSLVVNNHGACSPAAVLEAHEVSKAKDKSSDSMGRTQSLPIISRKQYQPNSIRRQAKK